MSVIIVIACAYLLVEITWMLVPQEDAKVLSVQKKNGSVNNRQAQQNSFRQLTSANIFGVSQSATVSKQTKAPVTKLNLTLKGVLAAIPMKMASAIIAQGKSGKEDIYGVGDKISGGVLIKEIHPEHVVLERSGRREILKLQKISGVNLKSTRQAKYNSSSGRSTGTSGRALSNIRRDILKNPTSFADYALPVIVKENGKQIGYRLQPQKKGELLTEMGLLPTDVVIQINGVKLDKPQNGISALRKLSTAKNLDLVVKRNGAEVPLSITLQ
ncbi:MAG: type II secretion system protein GspC [Gammaproteobacteria bacterium]|nr:type II secretion system protein GspC [Gammaproteobacteria bacterium]